MNSKIMKEALKPLVSSGNLLKYGDLLAELMPKYGIDTPLRQRHFLAQLLHESNRFELTRENLNYNADGLLKTFPKYFNKAQAKEFAWQPEKIANRVYANRMGNGNEASGEGWRYIGRGLIQTTGKDNYRAASQARYRDNRLLDTPSLLELPHAAVESACYFWNANNLNVLADKNDIDAVTRRINGGLNGLADRKKYFSNLKLSN